MADNDVLINSWLGLPNPDGQLAFAPNDTWWRSMPSADALPPAGYRLWPTYFVLVPGGRESCPPLSFRSRPRVWGLACGPCHDAAALMPESAC